MKHLKRLLATLLMIALVATMLPAVYAANGTNTATDAMNAIWEEIDAMYATNATKDGSVSDPAAVAQKAAAIVESSKDYQEGTLTWNGNSAFTFETEDGLPGLYNGKLMQEQHSWNETKSITDVTSNYSTINDSRIVSYGLSLNSSHTFSARYGSSSEIICLFAPYYGLDKNFTDAYLSNAIAMAKAAGCCLVVYTQTAASLTNLANAMRSCKLVMVDTHGTTDYYNKITTVSSYPDYYYAVEDCTSRANASYICLKTNSGITSTDAASVQGTYGRYYHAASSGSNTYVVDGTAIANHISGNTAGGFAWIGSCLGMATEAIVTPLMNKAMAGVYGYSQSITFAGDIVYLKTVADNLISGRSFARSIHAAKSAWGSWDPVYRYYYTFYSNNYYWYDYTYNSTYNGRTCGTPTVSMLRKDKIAFPITVSSKDRYPGRSNVDNIQSVYCDWYLTSPRSVHDRFIDVPDNAWYITAVDYVISNGIMNGNTNGTFCPESALTRAELVTLLHNKEGKPAATSNVYFTDVANNVWYAPQIKWAASVGIVNGYTDGSFQPNKQVTREELAQMIFSYAKYKRLDTSSRASLTGFRDYRNVGAWATPAMQWAVAQGIISGSNGNLLPGYSAKRCEVASMIMRFIQKYKL